MNMLPPITFDENVHNLLFNHEKPPAILVVDDFYHSPQTIRSKALDLEFAEDNRYYKGKRSTQRMLPRFLREKFESFLNLEITDWLNQPANGVFQLTSDKDPIVWHSDLQRFAAAIYLTPDAPLNSGTSFWRSREFGYRRPSDTPVINGLMYSEYNLLHEASWELVDRVGAVFNRLVMWDAQLIHSATSYEGLPGTSKEDSRLVQLFFFNAK